MNMYSIIPIPVSTVTSQYTCTTYGDFKRYEDLYIQVHVQQLKINTLHGFINQYT